MLLKQLPNDDIAMFLIESVTLAPVTAVGFEALRISKGFAAVDDFAAGVIEGAERKMGHVPVGNSEWAACGQRRDKICDEVIAHHGGEAEIGAEGDFWHHGEQA